MNRPPRHPSEIPTFLVTLLVVSIMLLLTIAALTGLTAGIAFCASFCAIPVLGLILVGISNMANTQHHQALMQQGYRVPVEQPTGQGDILDQLGEMVRECRKTLGCEPVDMFIVPAVK